MIGIAVATAIMAAYLGWYLARYGVPFSISRTVFKLPHEVIFTLVMYAVAFLTIVPMMDACSEDTKVMAFRLAEPTPRLSEQYVAVCGAAT